MNEINGFHNEYNFAKYLNSKKIEELNPLFKEFILELFGDIDNQLYYLFNVHNNLILLYPT